MKSFHLIKSVAQKTIFSSVIAFSACQMAHATAALDSTFGTGGQVTTSFPGNSLANGVATDQSNRTIVAGSTTETNGDVKFAITRYLTNGSLDTTFGTSGTVVLPVIADPSGATAVAIQADGKIVVVGTGKKTAITNTGVLARLNSDGSLDTTFGTNGITTVSNIGSLSPLGMVLDPQEKIIFVGSYRNSVFVARYTTVGQPDTTFGNINGLVRVQQANDATSVARKVTVTPNGKIAIAGFTTLSDNSVSWLIMQFTSTGTLDSTFGTNGQLTLPFVAGTSNNLANGIVAKSDNSLYVGGRIFQPATLPSADMAVAHILSNGTLDPSFGTGGYTRVAFGTGYASEIKSLTLDSSGYIVAGGNTAYTSMDFMVARFTPSGALDTTFTSTGYLQTHVSVGTNSGNSLAIQGDGKILLTGSVIDGNGKALFGTIRITP